MMTRVGMVLSATLAVFFAALLFRAAWHKAWSFSETTGFVTAYGIVPSGMEGIVVRAAIVAEGLLLVALIVPATRGLGAACAGLLLTGYALGMARALHLGRRRIDCGCGGAPQIVSALTITRNLALAATALVFARLPTSGMNGASADPLGVALALLGGATLWCLHAAAEQILANVGHMRLDAEQG